MCRAVPLRRSMAGGVRPHVAQGAQGLGGAVREAMRIADRHLNHLASLTAFDDLHMRQRAWDAIADLWPAAGRALPAG